MGERKTKEASHDTRRENRNYHRIELWDRAWNRTGTGKGRGGCVLNSFTDSQDDHALAEEIGKEFGITARYIKADMSKGDECRNLIEQAGAVISSSIMQVFSMWRRLMNSR